MNVLVHLIFYLLPLISYAGDYAGGTGEPSDPYQIATVEQFVSLGYHPNDFDKHFVLNTSLDFNEIDSELVRPIGSRDQPFDGTFAGKGYTLSNLRIIGHSDYVGVFGWLGKLKFRSRSDAQVTHLHLVDVEIVGNNNFVGGLAGHNLGRISNCSCHSGKPAKSKKSLRRRFFGGGGRSDCSADLRGLTLA